MIEANTFQDEAAIRARQMAEIRADSAMRFELMVQRLASMPTDRERAEFLQLVENHHDKDLQKLGAQALKRGLAHRLRLAVWARLYPVEAAS